MKRLIALLVVTLVLLCSCTGQTPQTTVTSEPNATTDSATTSESAQASGSDQAKPIKVASHTAPMTDMLELIKDDLLKEGFALEIVKVSDNVQANVALHNKEVDANFFQHKLFMEMYNQGNSANLVQVTPIYDAVVAFYGKGLTDIKDLKDGADIAIPSDPTNMTRALRLLAQHSLIALKDPNSYAVTVEDIQDNPKNLVFTAISLLNLNEAYNEKDLVFNYPAYATKIGLSPDKDGLLLESGDDMTFAVSLVAREDNLSSEEIVALAKVLTSQKIKDFIQTKLEKVARPAF